MLTRGQFIMKYTVGAALQKQAHMPLLRALGRAAQSNWGWFRKQPRWKQLLLGAAAAPTTAKGVELITPESLESLEEKRSAVTQDELAENQLATPSKDIPPLPVDQHASQVVPATAAEIPGANTKAYGDIPNPFAGTYKEVYKTPAPKTAAHKLAAHAAATKLVFAQ